MNPRELRTTQDHLEATLPVISGDRLYVAHGSGWIFALRLSRFAEE